MRSHEPPDDGCPFCRYRSTGWTEFPMEELHRDPEVFVKLNPKQWPNNRGDLLVIPIEHHENVYELPSELGTPIQRAVQVAASALEDALGCDGLSTRQHNEPAGNQDVWHSHVRVFPRRSDDGLYGSRGGLADATELRQLAERLRAVWPADRSAGA